MRFVRFRFGSEHGTISPKRVVINEPGSSSPTFWSSAAVAYLAETRGLTKSSIIVPERLIIKRVRFTRSGYRTGCGSVWHFEARNDGVIDIWVRPREAAAPCPVRTNTSYTRDYIINVILLR